MSTDKIIGLVTTARSFTFKMIADLYGGPRYETQDFFCSKSAQHLPIDEEAVSATLYSLAKRDIIRSVNEAVQEYAAITGAQPKNYPAILYSMPAEPVPVSIETPAADKPTEYVIHKDGDVTNNTPSNLAVVDTLPAGETQEYVVAEKPPTPQQPPAQDMAKAEEKTPTPPPQPLHKVIAERLKAMGVTKPEMTAWTNFYFNFPPGKLTQDQYIEAFTKAEDWIKANGIEKFRTGLEESKQAHTAKPPTQAPEQPQAVTDPFTADPAVQEAMKQIGKKWPAWSPELTRVASLWCADQVKDAAALDAFLISCGIGAVTPPGKIESLLAISRHMALSSGAAIMAYSKQSGNPLGMLESELSSAVGQPIRFAMELPANAVFEAFQKIIEQAKAGKK